MTQTVLLGDIIKKGDLTIHNKLRAPLNSRQRTEKQGGYPYYGATGRMDSIDEYKFDGLYVLVAEDGTVYGKNGVCPMIQRVRGKFWVSNHAHVLQGKDAIDTQYLALALEASDVRANITGAVQLKLSKDNLFKLKIYWPDRDEREAILNAIYPIDEKIELNRQMNETLEQMGQALFRHYFIDNPEAETGSVAKVSDFAEHLKISVQPMKSHDSIFHQYSIPGYDNSYLPEVSQGETIKSGKYEVAPNSILVSKLNPATPRVWAVIKPKDNAVCSTEFQVIKPKDYYAFYYFLLTSREFTEKMTMSAGGTSNSHRRVKPSDILDFAFARPLKEALAKFEAKAYPMIEQIDANRDEIQTLTTLRDTLLPRLIGGKVKV